MSAELVKTTVELLQQLQSIPPVPWRDPHSVSPEDLGDYIQKLEQACLAQPQSADLRTCLGVVYAVNFDVYKSIDTLAAATALDPTHFWARLKSAELQYRLRALTLAENETRQAVDLAQNGWQLSLARKQLHEIRALNYASTRNVTWDKPLTVPALVLTGMLTLIFVVMTWIH